MINTKRLFLRSQNHAGTTIIHMFEPHALLIILSHCPYDFHASWGEVNLFVNFPLREHVTVSVQNSIMIEKVSASIAD